MRSIVLPVSVILRSYFNVVRNACWPVETFFWNVSRSTMTFIVFEHRQETWQVLQRWQFNITIRSNCTYVHKTNIKWSTGVYFYAIIVCRISYVSYESCWNVISTVTRYNYHDCSGKIETNPKTNKQDDNCECTLRN